MTTILSLASLLLYSLDHPQPLGQVVDVPMTLVANKDFPPKNYAELIPYLKANKDKVNSNCLFPRWSADGKTIQFTP